MFDNNVTIQLVHDGLKDVEDSYIVGKDDNGNLITVKDLKENINQNTYKYEKPTCFVVWDDLIQLTSLGVVGLYCFDNYINDILINFSEEINAFLKRDIPDGKTYVLQKYQFITEEYFNSCITNRYEEVLEYSPATNYLKLLFSWASLYNNLVLFFKQSFNVSAMRDDFSKIFNNETRTISFYFKNEISLENAMEQTHPLMIISRDLNTVVSIATFKNKWEYVNYAGPLRVSELPPPLLKAYIDSKSLNQSNREFGPLMSQFVFIDQEVYKNEN